MEYIRESIIVSSIRTFCKSLAGVVGLGLGLVLVVVALMMFATPDIYPPASSIKIAPDAEGKRILLPSNAPVVLTLDIKGVVGMGDLTAEKFQNTLFDSEEGMFEGSRVKAVLLHINTPGGTVDDADAIYRALLAYKKKYNVPVYAFVDGLCASGGMYIASSADKIFATPASIIGSVGVILGPAFNFSGLMERYGVQALSLTEGKDKDMLSPFRPWRPGEDASLRAITAALYERFVSIVTEARPRLTRDKLINDYGAQIFVAQEAEKLGYIDVANASYEMALSELVNQAQIGKDVPYQVFTLAPSHPFLSELTEGKLSLLSGKVTHQLQLNASLNSELSGRFLYLYQPN